MIPGQDLLSRFRRDEHYGGDFVLGEYDRLTDGIVRVPLADIAFPPDDHFAFVVVDTEGTAHNVPCHRVREVFRNGELIWQRAPARGAAVAGMMSSPRFRQTASSG